MLPCQRYPSLPDMCSDVSHSRGRDTATGSSRTHLTLFNHASMAVDLEVSTCVKHVWAQKNPSFFSCLASCSLLSIFAFLSFVFIIHVDPPYLFCFGHFQAVMVLAMLNIVTGFVVHDAIEAISADKEVWWVSDSGFYMFLLIRVGCALHRSPKLWGF